VNSTRANASVMTMSAFEYRLSGASYVAIGEQMRIDPSTAHSYVVYCLQNLVPAEDAKEVLRQELARLDELQAAVFDNWKYCFHPTLFRPPENFW
jgi:hypothetical protein